MSVAVRARVANSLSIAESIPWIDITFDYTEKVCASIPPELMDWRPADPSGAYSFSLAEIAMHIADERLELARRLAGTEDENGYWTIKAAWASGQPWEFRQPANMVEVLQSLRRGRQALREWLERPHEELLETTAGTRAAFERHIAGMSQQGKEPEAALLKRGPASIVRIMMFLCMHESGHRGALQALLRQHGIHAGE
jgi:uncharacterized damage-inducible protein DinB